MALPALKLVLVQVQALPWMPTPPATLGLALPHFFIRMQKRLPGNLERKATALDRSQEPWHVLARPPAHSHRSRVLKDSGLRQVLRLGGGAQSDRSQVRERAKDGTAGCKVRATPGCLPQT